MTEGSERQLRPFQDAGAQKLIGLRKGMVIVDMGLGKTPITSKVGAALGAKRWLISCPENAVEVWRGDGARWIHQFSGIPVICHIMNYPYERHLEWNKLTPPNEIHLYIVVHNTFAKDMGVRPKKRGKKKLEVSTPLQIQICPKQGFDICIIDEARRIRNRDSAVFRALQQLLLRFSTPHIFPLTGTPSSRGPQDFWTMLNLLDRKRFSSYWGFVMKYCNCEKNYFGGLEILGPKQEMMGEFHALLQQYGLFIREDDPGIAEQRPPITRQPLEVEMLPDQEKAYRELRKDMLTYITQDDRLIIAQNVMVKMLRLRQMLVCPAMLSPSLGVGGAFTDYTNNIQDGTFPLPSVVFCPFTAAFPHFTNYLTSKGFPQDRINILEGGIGESNLTKRIQSFRERSGIILCSIQYAQAFSLEPATKSFFIGQEYDPDQNRQAEKRLHRLTTMNPINSYYYQHHNTIEGRVLKILNDKQENVNITLPKQLRALFTTQEANNGN